MIGGNDLSALVVAGLGVAVVSYGDNTLIARGFPAAPDQSSGTSGSGQIDPQQELLALAGVHVAVGVAGGFPVSSSGSRTALALAAGARSQVYSLVSALCVVVVLFAAGPLMSALPAAALGAVVLYAAGKLVSLREFVRLARFRPTELVLAMATLIGTVFFGILVGVAVAIALSLLEMAQRLARPHEGVLGRVPGVAGMHDVDDYPDAQTLPGLVIYRYDAPLFFANVGDLRRRAMLVVDQENAADPEHPVRWFVLNVEANVEVDITAADGLRDLHGDLAERGVRLGLARVKTDLREPLRRAGLVDLIGEEMLFLTLPVAEEAYLAWVATPNPR
jgi:SulP family sulfate permease